MIENCCNNNFKIPKNLSRVCLFSFSTYWRLGAAVFTALFILSMFFCHFFGHDAWANILVLRKENDYFITTNLNSHISADGVLNDDANEGAHHQMEIKS